MAELRKLTLHITIGNDAVQSGEDVAKLLRTAAAQIREYTVAEIAAAQATYRKLRDDNGHTVGEWIIE